MEINRVFTELGALLIDGDALLYFLTGYIVNPLSATDCELEALGSRVTIFLEHLHERGFKRIKIVLFENLTRYTSGDFNLEALFKADQLLVFNGYG